MNSESQDIDASKASISMACAEWPEGELMDICSGQIPQSTASDLARELELH